MANPFVHVELNTPNPEKAKTFYSKLFEWQLEDMPNSAVPDDSYTMIKVGEGTGDTSARSTLGSANSQLVKSLFTTV